VLTLELLDSKGKTKSKVTKSMKFGGGRWQILFYANSGTQNAATQANAGASTNANEDEEGYVSLYLSCEVSDYYYLASHPHTYTVRNQPTWEEKSSAVNGK
jgi:hypothetical protein